MWDLFEYVYRVIQKLNEEYNGQLNGSLVYNVDVTKIIPSVYFFFLLLVVEIFLFVFFFVCVSVIYLFIYFSWSLINSQYCSGFCHTLIWISHGLHNGTFQFAKCFCKYTTDEVYRGYGVGHIFIYQKPDAQKVRWLVWKVKKLVAQCVWLFMTLWTVSQQAPLSMEFSR